MGGWVAGFYKYITNSAQTEVRAGAELGNTTKLILLDSLLQEDRVLASQGPWSISAVAELVFLGGRGEGFPY